jgi:hypothetical protein
MKEEMRKPSKEEAREAEYIEFAHDKAHTDWTCRGIFNRGYKVAYEVQQAKIDSLQQELDCALDYVKQYQSEIERLRQPVSGISQQVAQCVSDEQIAEIHSELYSIYSEEEITYDDFAKTIRSILERK